VLAVGNDFVLGEAFDGERAVLDTPVPRKEMAKIITVAAQCRRREVVMRQTGEESRHPIRFGGDRLGCLYCTQSHPPL
jgi:hypothetical protein